PLPASEYKMFIRIEVFIKNDIPVTKTYPLGNILEFLPQEFYTTKMEYFSAKQEMQYNLLVTYDQSEKTLKMISTKLKDINPGKYAIQKNNTEGIFSRFMRTKGFRSLYKLFKLFRVNKKKVLFASDSRIDMSGNFHFVYNEMLQRNLELNYHFMLKNGVDDKKSFGEIVKLAYHMATAKYIMLDD